MTDKKETTETLETSELGKEVDPSIAWLINGCRAGEVCLHTASEHMQNRGVKLIVKRFAQQHRHFAQELSVLTGQSDPVPSSLSRSGQALRRGWMDIRIAMIVGRANRQSAAAARCVATERELVQAYDEALKADQPEALRDVLLKQRQALHETLEWLERLAEPDEWMVRLMPNENDAVESVKELSELGFDKSQMEVKSMHQLVQYEKDDELRVHSAVDATLVGGLIGAAVGLIAGPIVGWAVPQFVPAVPATQYALWVSILIWASVGVVVGAFFGAFFGLLIGSGVAEDDAELVEMTPVSDAYLVSVRTTPDNYQDAAKVLRMRHERELDASPA